MCGTEKEDSKERKRRCVTELMEEPRVHMYTYVYVVCVRRVPYVQGVLDNLECDFSINHYCFDVYTHRYMECTTTVPSIQYVILFFSLY